MTLADGSSFVAGDGSGPPLAVRILTHAAERALLYNPQLKFGECYMDGSLVVERGALIDLMEVLMQRPDDQWINGASRPQWLLGFAKRRFAQFNSRYRARKNVSHHYDLDGRLYSLFLDSDRQYSCGYFEFPGQPLDDAQLAKKRHIAAKLLLEPFHRVLDIGSGWGGLARYMADVGGARVDGITLSNEQLAYARAGAKDDEERVRFSLTDYRDMKGSYDRITSVGMFEHVGIGFYDEYFTNVARLLAHDGVFLLSAIGRSESPSFTNPWIAKYIFPGGYIPALSEVLPSIERAGLLVTDIEIKRLHYAETLKAWRDRFNARRGEALELYDDRFCRMWELYLAMSEIAFRKQNMMVFQIQITKSQGVVPITRNYIAEREAKLRMAEDDLPQPLPSGAVAQSW